MIKKINAWVRTIRGTKYHWADSVEEKFPRFICGYNSSSSIEEILGEDEHPKWGSVCAACTVALARRAQH